MCTRETDGSTFEFGTTGYTMDHIFLLYDRSTDSVWYPDDEAFTAVGGERKGEKIPILDEPAPIVLNEWLSQHPDSVVMLPSAEDFEMLSGRGNRPYMGVQLGDREGRLVVDQVVENTPASAAGLQDGDVIVMLDGGAISSRGDLREIMRDLEPGDVVKMEVERAGATIELEIELGSR